MSGYEGYADFSQAQPEKSGGGNGQDWSGYGQSVSIEFWQDYFRTDLCKIILGI